MTKICPLISKASMEQVCQQGRCEFWFVQGDMCHIHLALGVITRLGMRLNLVLEALKEPEEVFIGEV